MAIARRTACNTDNRLELVPLVDAAPYELSQATVRETIPIQGVIPKYGPPLFSQINCIAVSILDRPLFLFHQGSFFQQLQYNVRHTAFTSIF